MSNIENCPCQTNCETGCPCSDYECQTPGTTSISETPTTTIITTTITGTDTTEALTCLELQKEELPIEKGNKIANIPIYGQYYTFSVEFKVEVYVHGVVIE